MGRLKLLLIYDLRSLYLVWSELECFKSLSELRKCSPYVLPLVIFLSLQSLPLQMHIFIFNNTLKGTLSKFLGSSLPLALPQLPLCLHTLDSWNTSCISFTHFSLLLFLNVSFFFFFTITHLWMRIVHPE